MFSARYDRSIQVRVELRKKSAFRSLKQAITDLAVILSSLFYKGMLLLYTLSEHIVITLAFDGQNSSAPVVTLMEFSDVRTFESLTEHLI